ncbi:RDD family protein [Stackebrandtia soli]|uniref:RDD family protein n=1 Tax=Stackebrandtia soli TaxID=1892856 RepID=UPI0039E9F93F
MMATPEERSDSDLATFGQRFLALLGDWVLCLFIANGAMRVGLLPPHEFIWPSVVLIVEYTLFLGFSVQTPGMWLFKVRCVDIVNGRPLGLPRAFVRAVLLAVVLPIVPAFYDPRRRGFHDVAGQSIVLRA